MKKLLIDINSVVPFFVSGKVTGIGRTTYQLINTLDTLKNTLNFQISLISQNIKGVGSKQVETSFKGYHISAPNRNLVRKINKFIPIRELITCYDILHIPHNFEYVFNPEKTLVTLHDALFMKINEEEFDHLRMRIEVPKLLKKCKGVTTCSYASKKDIVETMSIDPEKIDVIYWGVDHDVFKPISDREKITDELKLRYGLSNPYFLSVSCNSGRKNTDKLIEAYIRLSKHDPLNDLVLLWPDPPGFIVRKIIEARLDKRIHILPNVPDDSLVLLYNNATAMIFPSAYEGFGLPVLEAMACGTTVITCRNSSLPEIGGNAALYLEYPSVENILASLELLENNAVDINSLVLRGIKQASKFRWDKAAGEYISVYKKHMGIED
jgi:glycosyltransferase involved in cell wall biosynthesis